MRQNVVTLPEGTPRPRHRPQSNGSGWPSALALVAGMLSAVALSAQQAATGAPAGSVRYDPERETLSVSVKDEPLVALFERISSETGVALVVHGGEHGVVTANFDELPLESAIKRLLNGRNYALSGAADSDHGIKVWLMAPGQAPPNTRPARLATARQSAVQRSARRTVRTQDRSAAVSEQLRQILAADGDDAARGLRVLLDENEDLGEMIRDALRGEDVPPELLEIIEDKLNQ